MKIQIDTKKILRKIAIKNHNAFGLMLVTGLASALFLGYLLIPTIIYVLNSFLQLVNLYSWLEDKNFIFLGAIFFFIVSWKVLEFIANIFKMFLIEYAKNLNKAWGKKK